MLSNFLLFRYKAVFIPDLHFPPRKEFREFWKRVSPPILRKSAYMVAVQVALGALITYKEFLISRELYASITPEEFSAMWEQAIVKGRIHWVFCFSDFEIKFFAYGCGVYVQHLPKLKSNLHYTRDITPKRVTSSGIHLRGLGPGQHSSEETSEGWRHCVRFDQPGIRTRPTGQNLLEIGDYRFVLFQNTKLRIGCVALCGRHSYVGHYVWST